MLILPTLLLLITHFTPFVTAWGMLGHRATALLATRYLHPETALFVRSLLYKDETIMSAACWADRYAHVPLGRYSAPWHYIDAKDSPPEWCGVMYSRDCQGEKGCIVSALVNMTSRVTNTELRWYERSKAMKFILHFLGDIHQPLHTEDLKRGGNDVHVLFRGRPANLHSVWDSRFLDSHMKGNNEQRALELVNKLEKEIDEGIYKSKREGWRKCLNPKKAEDCAIEWATGSNKIVCNYVLRDGELALTGKEVSGSYMDGAIDIILEQIAMGGYRLAGYLNMLVTNSTGLEDDVAVAIAKAGLARETERKESKVWGQSPFCAPLGYWDGDIDHHEYEGKFEKYVVGYGKGLYMRMKQLASWSWNDCRGEGEAVNGDEL